MAMLHGQFALYAIDLDYFFTIGLGNQGDYDKLKLLTNSNDSDSPVEEYKGITLPAPGVEVGRSPYSADSKNSFLDRMREIVSVLKSPRLSNVVLEDKLSQYAMIAKDPSGNPYPLEIEVFRAYRNSYRKLCSAKQYVQIIFHSEKCNGGYCILIQ